MARPKGSLNSKSIALKTMILNALERAGGEDYLSKQAKDNPTAFLTLIGKVLPMDIAHSGNMGITVNIKRFSDGSGNRPASQ